MPALLIYAGAGLAVLTALVFLRLWYLLEKFTCGSCVDDVIEEAKYYNSLGLGVLINYAAEEMNDSQKNAALKVYLKLLDRMDEEGIDGDLSVKPTSFVSRNACVGCKKSDLSLSLETLLERMARSPKRRWLWLDEEKTKDLEWVDAVIEDLVLNRGHRGLAIRVRAYIKPARTRVAKFMSWVTDDPMLLSGPHQGISACDIKIGVCRGTYKEDAELTAEETEKQFIEIMDMCLSHGVEAVCASHTMVKKVVWSQKLQKYGKAEIHMLHGRGEVDSTLLPFLKVRLKNGEIGYIKKGAVYLIHSSLNNLKKT
ncbi:MAG: hypothetical protein AAB527_02655, partial [Patescibacteria group bacterium]